MIEALFADLADRAVIFWSMHTFLVEVALRLKKYRVGVIFYQAILKYSENSVQNIRLLVSPFFG
ncbi:MAG: hypothetical protein WCQ99_14845 [Pseudomonadota bacterium]